MAYVQDDLYLYWLHMGYVQDDLYLYWLHMGYVQDDLYLYWLHMGYKQRVNLITDHSYNQVWFETEIFFYPQFLHIYAFMV
jgi:hypothetical protein